MQQARAETARLNQEAITAKRETEAAKSAIDAARQAAARLREMAKNSLKAANARLELAQRNTDEANARLKSVEERLNAAEKNAKDLQQLADRARDEAAKAEDQSRFAEKVAADAFNRAEEANKQVKAAEDRLKAANEAIELANELQSAQDVEAKKKDYARGIFRFHSGPVTNVAIHPQNNNNNLIVTASEDGRARVVDLRDEKSAKNILATQSALNSAVFSSDGKSVVTISAEGAIRVFDANTGKEHTGLAGRIGSIPLKSVQQWDEGRRVIGNLSSIIAMEGTETGTLQVWDLTDLNKGPVVLRGRQGEPNSLTVSPDGDFIAAVNKDNKDNILQVWRRAEPEKAPAVFRGHSDLVTSLAFSQDETLLVTTSKDKTARAWSLADPGKKPVVMNKHRMALTSVAFSPTRRWVVTASEDGRALVWAAESGKVVAELRKRTFISVNYVSHRRFPLNIFFPISFDFLSKGDLPRINSAAFSPDGKYVVTASDDGAAQIWNVETAKTVATLRGHILGVQSAIFTPDGKSVITAGADHTVRLWDLCKEKTKPISVCEPAVGKTAKR
jgi:WD40 repeat protein